MKYYKNKLPAGTRVLNTHMLLHINGTPSRGLIALVVTYGTQVRNVNTHTHAHTHTYCVLCFVCGVLFHIVLARCILPDLFSIVRTRFDSSAPPFDWPRMGKRCRSFPKATSRLFCMALLIRLFSASARASLCSVSVWSSGFDSSTCAEGRRDGSGCIIDRTKS